jgi:hypothetical protein
LNNTALTSVNIEVFAAIPIAIDNMAISLKPGVLINIRAA